MMPTSGICNNESFEIVSTATIDICCPRCQSTLVYRHGQNARGTDRFRCRDCHRVFCLITLKTPGNTVSKSKLLRWLLTAPVSVIPPGR
ncbi:IS1 family transposase [Salmonella enterica]